MFVSRTSAPGTNAHSQPSRLRHHLRHHRHRGAQIHARLVSESYTPRTWRTHPLHLCPPEPYDASDPRTLAALHWLFFVSSLNFSFWSPREGQPDRYGVEWRTGWGRDDRAVWTGYWSLLAAVNRGEVIRAPRASFVRARPHCVLSPPAPRRREPSA